MRIAVRRFWRNRDDVHIVFLQRETPAKVRELVRRCLRKDRARRLHDIADARLDVEEAFDEPALLPIEEAPQRRPAWRYALVAVLASLATGFVVWNVTRSVPVPEPQSRFAINLPEDAPVDIRGFPSLALSPDGTKLVYVVQRDEISQLYIRDVEKFEAEPIPGTEGGIYPFFSQDGEWIGYFDLLAGKLEKVSIHGGATVEICETYFGRGASWGVDDTIVFSTTTGIYRVPASGGSPQIVTSPDRERGITVNRYPQILPDGESVLFMFGTSTILPDTSSLHAPARSWRLPSI